MKQYEESCNYHHEYQETIGHFDSDLNSDLLPDIKGREVCNYLNVA